MMFVTMWTLNHGNNILQDMYELHETEAEAMAQFQLLCENESNLHCAAVSEVTYATEPHWTEGPVHVRTRYT